MEIEHYRFIGKARDLTHHAVRGNPKSGGVAILVKDAVYTDYSVDTCCADTEGILGIKLTHRKTDYVSIVVCNYLPPANSIYGGDPETFFGRLLSLSYEQYDADVLLYVGDFNARIGRNNDILDVDSCNMFPLRVPADVVQNAQGGVMLDFLNDSCSLVLNGRICDADYTCHTAQGASEIDFVIVPYDVYDKIQLMSIHTMEEIVHDLQLEDLVGEGSSLPDHSLLRVVFRSTGHHAMQCMEKNNENRAPSVPRKFKSEYMNNERISRAMCGCVETLLSNTKSQESVDKCYNELCALISSEMELYRKVGKRKGTPSKPYWSAHLSELWKSMRDKYRLAKPDLKTRSRRHLKHAASLTPNLEGYLRAATTFDKELRAAKRRYNLDKIVHMDLLLKTGDPKAFWDAVNELGPRSKKHIICEAFDQDGAVTREINTVMEHWTAAFSALYGDPPVGEFNDEFYMNKLMTLQGHTPMVGDDPLELNRPITLDEVKKIILQSKAQKATGIDRIPNEAVKNELCINLLHKLFVLCFEHGILPSAWGKSVVIPIGKGKTSCSTEPLSHRGLSMQSCIYKLFSLLLSRRVQLYAEGRGLLSETQNGFRRDRGCVDHVFSLCEIVRMNTPRADCKVYTMFVDFRKAFPSVDRNLLLARLIEIGVDGKLFQSIANTYRSPQCCLRVNGMLSEFFPSNYGTLEGDCQSPLNFALFLDGLLQELNTSGFGIYYGDALEDRVACLAYADDLVLIASSEWKLQKLSDILCSYCRKWRLSVNIDKTKVLVFKRNFQTRSIAANIKFGGSPVEQVKSYRYLGVRLDEVLSFNECFKELGASGGRALGAVIQKCKTVGDMSYKTFTQLVDSCVYTVTDYGAEITGHKTSKVLDDVQYKAARFYLGVNRHCSLPCLYSEMGWLSNFRRRHKSVIRYYNRLVRLEDHRLPKRIYKFSKHNSNSWSCLTRELLEDLGLQDYWWNDSPIPVELANFRLRELCLEEYWRSVMSKSKLRLFRTLRCGLSPAKHVVAGLNKRQRSLISRLRCGVLHLRIETGRFVHESIGERLCLLCDENQVESEHHFIFDCQATHPEREELFDKLPRITTIAELCDHPFILGNYLERIWNKRCNLLTV